LRIKTVLVGEAIIGMGGVGLCHCVGTGEGADSDVRQDLKALE
jgi:hypothetical protein